MHYIVKKLDKFSAAHRLINGYQGKCKHLHGHTYLVEIALEAQTLNEFGFVMDFDDIKKYFNNWVQSHWDHATLVSSMDTTLIDFLKIEQQHYFVIPGNKNTSSECLSEFLYHHFNTMMNSLQTDNHRIRIAEVRVHESDTAMAAFKACQSNPNFESQEAVDQTILSTP